MAQMYVARCDCCGLEIGNSQIEFCPRCQYPVQPEKEQRFLEVALHDLRRVMHYGGAAITVTDLVYRYEGRLQFLLGLKARAAMFPAASVPVQPIVATPIPASSPTPDFEMVSAPPQPDSPSIPVAPLPGTTHLSVTPQPPVAQPGAPLATGGHSLSLSSDAIANIFAALGGFFVLAGALSIGLINGPWLSFLVVFLVHAAFGGAGLITRRIPLLRAVSHLYIIIFALLVPLVGFSAYRLVANNLVEFSAPSLLALAALYATVIYALLAVVQRFTPFAYLSMVALLIADLALARTLNLAYWWWPCMAMLLALSMLFAIPRAPKETGPLQTAWTILRIPGQVLMYAIVGTACLLLPFVLAYSWLLDSLRFQPVEEVRLALLCLACLLFAWFTLKIWQTRSRRWTPLLACLFVGVLLLTGYALNFDRTGYVLLLACTALLYHGLVSVAGIRLAVYGLPDLALDVLAVALSAVVLLLVAFYEPFQLIYRALSASLAQNTLFINSSITQPLVPGSDFLFTTVASGICFFTTLDITIRRAGLSKVPVRASWCWLLTLSGLLLISIYGQEVLLWQLPPLWAFLILSLALLTCTVLVRRSASAAWANPLDILTLGVIAFTLVLSLGQTPTVVSSFFLGFAALLYGVLLYQRRPRPAVLSSLLLLLALPFLADHQLSILILCLLLPLLAAGMWSAGLFGTDVVDRNLFAWTLCVPALFYDFALLTIDITGGQSVFAAWSGLHMAVAYELAAPGLAWYAAALIARVKSWLVPAACLWLIALIWPTNDFWTLAVLTPGLALVTAYIDRRANASWAWPFFLAALCGAGMVGYTGLAQQHVAEMVRVMSGFALLAYSLGLFTRRQFVLWLTPLFATWAVLVAAAQLGNLYLPPLVVIVGAGLGVIASRSSLLLPLATHRRATFLYALPLYVTALLAAVLTGIYGELGDINRPFYGALPSALLVYALVAYVVLSLERRPAWNVLVALFACWGILLAQRLAPSYIVGAGVALALAGLLSGRLYPSAQPDAEHPPLRMQARFTWNWPWYLAFVVATFVLGNWPYAPGHAFTPGMLVPEMLVFTLLACVVMLVERAPEFLVFPAGLAAWTLHLWLSPSQPALLILAYTLLCALLFFTRFIWRIVPATTRWLPETSLHNALSLGGLCAVLLDALNKGAVSAHAGNLAHAGVGALVTLSLLLILHGLLHTAAVMRVSSNTSGVQHGPRLTRAHAFQRWCFYIAGLLLSCAVSWELLAFQQTRFDVLTLVPASYLIVVAPFLLHDRTLPGYRFAGQVTALAGAALLLLPSLWFSFNESDLLPTLILLAESLVLLALGLITRLRIFILSSAALIVVGTLRVLFLSVPPSVPILLMIFGSLLVLLATVLILSRHRLQAAWSRWE